MQMMTTKIEWNVQEGSWLTQSKYKCLKLHYEVPFVPGDLLVVNDFSKVLLFTGIVSEWMEEALWLTSGSDVHSIHDENSYLEWTKKPISPESLPIRLIDPHEGATFRYHDVYLHKISDVLRWSNKQTSKWGVLIDIPPLRTISHSSGKGVYAHPSNVVS